MRLPVGRQEIQAACGGVDGLLRKLPFRTTLPEVHQNPLEVVQGGLARRNAVSGQQAAQNLSPAGGRQGAPTGGIEQPAALHGRFVRRRRFFQHGQFVLQQPDAGQDVLIQLRQSGAPLRQAVVAQPVAQIVAAAVAGVAHKSQLVPFGIGFQLGAAVRQQRPPQQGAAVQRAHGGHGRQGAQAAAAQGGKHKGFHLVVGMMGGGEYVGFGFAEHAVTRLPCRRFDTEAV